MDFSQVWDLRTYAVVNSFQLDQPASCVDISDRGLVAAGVGRRVQVLQHALTLTHHSHANSHVTYLTHAIRTPNPNLSSGAGAVAARNALLSNVSVSSVKFCPFEDILCVGHSHGLSSIVVPGAGEPNYDSFEGGDPFRTGRQRREAEVQGLLSKLSPSMIGLGKGARRGVGFLHYCNYVQFKVLKTRVLEPFCVKVIIIIPLS